LNEGGTEKDEVFHNHKLVRTPSTRILIVEKVSSARKWGLRRPDGRGREGKTGIWLLLGAKSKTKQSCCASRKITN